ncbi:cytochrome c oxidase assembly protein [Rhizobium hidalgonense]|uniref:cytochrome c oxidase assembly protein n=1 Tax=Rhizobium hidalgonense TaxID=1538159 RepID=UPI002871788C|nr:cytochrome c oxidase assembly protein [Rhizobium hidalgonense]MDR9805726.1 cytochrome c oxidase assembly protein [Rhizobium hidalgonense]
MRTLIALALTITTAGAAFAHGAEAHPASYGWTFDPWVVVPLCTLAAMFAIGACRLLWRVSPGRAKPLLRIVCYFAGLLALTVALVSPIHWLGEHLFTFHMVEHEIVMAIAAPLLVLSRPAAMCVWSLPRFARRWTAQAFNASPVRGLWSRFTGGVTATVVHAVAIWTWHVPMLLDVSVTNIAMHRLQHLSFFITALLFWWAVIWRSERGAAAWHLFVTMMHTSVLGALIALSPRVLYVAQTASAPEWGLTPLEDQQMAGMLMWIPAGTVYAGAAIFLLSMWIRDSGRGGAKLV